MPRSEEDFWARVDRSAGGCWVWTGPTTRDGYGKTNVWSGSRYVAVLAHRHAFTLTRGPILKVLHGCDNPPCCRPDHLWSGTQRDNVRDCVAKGRRSRHGGRPAEMKLDRTIVDDIRRRARAATHGRMTEGERSTGLRTHKELAVMYGISPSMVSQIACGRTWAD